MRRFSGTTVTLRKGLAAAQEGESWLCAQPVRSSDPWDENSLSWAIKPQPCRDKEVHLHLWLPSRESLVTQGRNKFNVTFTRCSWTPCWNISCSLASSLSPTEKTFPEDPKILKTCLALYKHVYFNACQKWARLTGKLNFDCELNW